MARWVCGARVRFLSPFVVVTCLRYARRAGVRMLIFCLDRTQSRPGGNGEAPSPYFPVFLGAQCPPLHVKARLDRASFSREAVRLSGFSRDVSRGFPEISPGEIAASPKGGRSSGAPAFYSIIVLLLLLMLRNATFLNLHVRECLFLLGATKKPAGYGQKEGRPPLSAQNFVLLYCFFYGVAAALSVRPKKGTRSRWRWPD